MIDGRNFDQSVKNDIRTYDNIRKIAIGQGDDYTTGCLLDYSYFKEYYKLIAIDLSKQQKLGADPNAINKLIFQEIQIKMEIHKCTDVFIIEKAKESVLDFSKEAVNLLQFYFGLI